MADTAILVPAAVLLVWTMVMFVWMLVHRSMLFRQHGIRLDKMPPGAIGRDIPRTAPDAKDWVAQNYNHLMEQPTAFYAACVILSLGGATAYDAGLAWFYVVIRIAHSIWQARVNVITIRAALFVVSSLALALLSVRALLSVLG
ncbi:MAPEG family protein [Croceicoccus sp. Ery15]|uniref:MAPEG family protein n=1 Tax=Croceicoccus sp. Ery15 TaxID=1703338 RepID=UPI001E3906AB|nr:MAPEG family protein [Croceicoccus sp. Ery15]